MNLPTFDRGIALNHQGAELILRRDGTVTNAGGVPYRPSVNTKGYSRIFVKNVHGKTLTLNLHTLLAKVFLGYTHGKDYVLFVDGNKQNCAVSNLKVTSRLQHRKELKALKNAN
jgi:hypothetical protein